MQKRNIAPTIYNQYHFCFKNYWTTKETLPLYWFFNHKRRPIDIQQQIRRHKNISWWKYMIISRSQTNISTHINSEKNFFYIATRVRALCEGNSHFLIKLQIDVCWKKPCKALWQTIFNCTRRLGRTQWTIMSHNFHAIICSIPWWIILTVRRSGSSQPDSLKIQSRIHFCIVREEDGWGPHFVLSNVLMYLPLRTRKIFQSCDKSSSCWTITHILLHTSLYFSEQWKSTYIFFKWIDIPGRGSSNTDNWDSESPQLQKNLVLSLVPETLQGQKTCGHYFSKMPN